MRIDNPDTSHLGGEHLADRLIRAQKISSDVYLHGDPPPTPRQVGAVLHALADHTLISHLLSDAVKDLGADRAHLGGDFAQANGIGRLLQAMGDYLDRDAT